MRESINRTDCGSSIMVYSDFIYNFPFSSITENNSKEIRIFFEYHRVDMYHFFPNCFIPVLEIFLYPVGYFILGMTLHLYKRWETVPTHIGAVCGFFSFGISCFVALDSTEYLSAPTGLKYLHQICSILTIICFYSFIEKFKSLNKFCFPVWLPFWTYCLHSVFIGYFSGMFLYLFGRTNIVSIVIFFLTPWIMIACCWLSGVIISKYFKKLFKFLNGGRV